MVWSCTHYQMSVYNMLQYLIIKVVSTFMMLTHKKNYENSEGNNSVIPGQGEHDFNSYFMTF